VLYTINARDRLQEERHPSPETAGPQNRWAHPAALEKLAEDPQRDDVDVIPLKGTEGFRLRVGDWRVLYDLGQEEREEPESDATEQVTVIMVQAISPRGGAYKRGKRR
jgi:mRNA-degrading endonuclease RelE of RelBE toxin-antitoxin system